MSPFFLLLIYCLILIGLALLGGWLPNAWSWNHVRIQLLMSFIAGFMLAVAFVQLVPHAYNILNDGRTVGLTVMSGLLVMFFLIRIFDFHHHHFPTSTAQGATGRTAQPVAEQAAHLSCAHDHDHSPPAMAGWSGRPKSLAWLGLLIGLGLHSVIEAIALAASMQAVTLSEGMPLSSLAIFLAIALHKPLDAMSIASVMTVSRWSPQEKRWVNWLYAGLGPLAAMVAYWGFGWLPADTTVALGFALAFSGGTFLCISLGDLLPELHFHSHDRLKLSLCLLAGVILVILLELLPLWNRAG